jgi:hypothetical protein
MQDSDDRLCLTKFKVAPSADVQANQLRYNIGGEMGGVGLMA